MLPTPSNACGGRFIWLQTLPAAGLAGFKRCLRQVYLASNAACGRFTKRYDRLAGLTAPTRCEFLLSVDNNLNYRVLAPILG